MIQNIKVDTIYYLTNSDFEMEFNLCGCCKMRLLTDKAENAKNFIGLLSRAVSRSQVIICCGKLFDNNGLINVVSQAIKKPLYTVNNEDFGIADDSEINIIEGSLPLVNSDGCFCGCIAESGPQSIILLTDNKSIRKTVMKELIHPYIEELCITSIPKESILEEVTDSEEVAETETDTEALLEEETTEEISEETEENAESVEETEENVGEPTNDAETLEETEATEENQDSENSETSSNDAQSLDDNQTETDNGETTEDVESDTKSTPDANVILPEVIMDEEEPTEPEMFMDAAQINSGFELYLEPERVKFSKKSHYELNYVPSERDNEFISESSDNEFLAYEKNKIISLPILIISIILLIAVALLVYLLVFIPMNSNYTFSEYIRNIFSVSVNIPFSPFNFF